MKEDTIKTEKSYSLAPTTIAEDMDIYGPIIKSIIEEKEENCDKLKNNNIAVMGSFGAGKSSIISSYFKDKDNILYVSLGSYIERKHEKEKEKESADEMDRIETSILQQILYSVTPEDLPFSRISRIDSDYKRKEKRNIVISSILTIIIVLLYEIKNYETLIKIFHNKENIIIFSFISSFIWIIIKMFLDMLSNITFRKATINGVEVSKEESDISVLNRNIDELIHFFKQTHYSIVVFEDIDRLDNCREVFSKLKEINIILNNAIKNKTIQFIYAVGDTVFHSSEERTKFFDGIITIIPYTGNKVSIDLFKKEENYEYHFDDDILKIICRYIDNPRIVKDIITEYSVYYEMLKKTSKENTKIIQSDRNILLVLCSYKVLYPKKYKLLLKGKGKIAYYLSNSFPDTAKEIILQNHTEKIKEAKSIKKSIRDFNTNFNNYIFSFVKEEIRKKHSIPKQIVKEEDNSPICNFDDIQTSDFNILNKILNNNIIIECENMSKVFEKDLNQIINKEDFINLLKFSKTYDSIEDLEESINENQEVIDNFNIKEVNKNKLIEVLDSFENNDLVEEFYISKEDEKELGKIEEILPLNLFEKWMIQSNIISNTYKRLMIKNHETDLNQMDIELIKTIEQGEKVDYDRKVHNPKRVLEEISKYDFSNNSICVKGLFKELIKYPSTYKEYIDYFFINLNYEKVSFLIKLEKDKIKLLSIFENHSEKLVDYMKSNNITFDKDLLVAMIVSTNKEPSEKVLKFVREYMGTVEEVEKIYVKYSEYFLLNLPNYKVEWKQENFIAYIHYKRFYDFIEKNNMINLNINLIKSLAKVLKYKFNENKVLESIYSNNPDNSLVKLLENDSSKTIEFVNSLKNLQKDSEDFLISFLSNHDLSNSEVELLIKKEDIKIKDISKIGYYDILKRNNKIDISFKNLNTLYEENEKELDEYMINTVINKIDNLIKQKIDYDQYEDILIDLLYSDKIENDIFKKLVDFTSEGRDYNTWNTHMNLEKNQYLIQSGKMYDTKGEYTNLTKIINNEELNSSDKLLYLKNSYNTIKNKYYEEMDNNVLNYITKIDVDDKQELIDYIYQYHDKFNSITYQNIFGICISNRINLPTDDLIDIIKNTSALGTNKLKLFLQYKEMLKEYIKELLPYFGEDYNNILKDRTRKKLQRTSDNEELVNVLINQGIIQDIDLRKKIIVLFYNPRRIRKNT